MEDFVSKESALGLEMLSNRDSDDDDESDEDDDDRIIKDKF